MLVLTVHLFEPDDNGACLTCGHGRGPDCASLPAWAKIGLAAPRRAEVPDGTAR